MNIKLSQRKSSGFTIVELLIVIVVIAILTTIVIVSYRGIRERAEASAIITHVKQYADIFETYIIDNGRAPLGAWRCLGDATSLPATDKYEENLCFTPPYYGGTGDFAPADPNLMAQLKSTNEALPTSTFPDAKCIFGRTCRGIVYDGSTGNFPNAPAVLVYFTNLTYCPIGDKVDWWTEWSPDSTSGCAYRLSVNEGGTLR